MAARMNRRATILGVGALVGFYWGWPRAVALLQGGPEFEPLPGVAGFRRVSGNGQVSGGFDPLTFQVSADGEAQRRLRDGLRGSLFTAVHRTNSRGKVPVAAFSDYHCPYCRVLTGRLSALADEADLAMTWHEWPILGPNSVSAARAALAADMQGAYAAFHKRMMRSRFVADPRFVRKVAEDIGIDPDRMVTDMGGSAVERRLSHSKAVAGLLQLPGTPALVVGRTVITGAVEDRLLKTVIASEREST